MGPGLQRGWGLGAARWRAPRLRGGPHRDARRPRACGGDGSDEPRRQARHTTRHRPHSPSLFPLAGGHWLRLAAVPQRESVPHRQPADGQRRRPRAPFRVGLAGQPHRRHPILEHAHQFAHGHGRGVRQEVQPQTRLPARHSPPPPAPSPPPTPHTHAPPPQAPRPHHSLAPQNPTPLTSPPQQLPAPTSCVLNDPHRVAPSQLASARPEPSGAAAAAALAAALAADGRVRVRHLPVWRLHGLPRLRVLRLL